MNIDDFINLVKFPPPPRVGVVYVIFWVLDGVRTPLYVGQTERFLGRMEDYQWGDFMAATDFKVREATKYLEETRKCEVFIASLPSEDRKADEAHLITTLRQAGVKLLNDLGGYRYSKANEGEERLKIRNFCDTLRSAYQLPE